MKKLMLIILGLGVGFTFTQCEFSNDIDPNQPSLSQSVNGWAGSTV